MGVGRLGWMLLGETLTVDRRRYAGREVQARDRDGFEGFGGVEGRGLVGAVVERVEQAIVDAEAAAHRGFAVAQHVPGEAHAGRRQEFGAVGPERRVAHDGRGLQNAVDDVVIRRAALRLVPSVC